MQFIGMLRWLTQQWHFFFFFGYRHQHYEYIMDARFRGPDDCDEDSTTCRVASSIMEPFFAVSPVRNLLFTLMDRERMDLVVVLAWLWLLFLSLCSRSARALRSATGFLLTY